MIDGITSVLTPIVIQSLLQRWPQPQEKKP